MIFRKFFLGRAVVLIVLLFIVVGYYAFNSLNDFIYGEKQAENETHEPYRGTLSGEYVCLPLKENNDLPREECIFSLKTETGEHYTIDFNLMSQELPTFRKGDRFKATGLITPIENLSSDQWRKYSVNGIFSVTDSVQILAR